MSAVAKGAKAVGGTTVATAIMVLGQQYFAERDRAADAIASEARTLVVAQDKAAQAEGYKIAIDVLREQLEQCSQRC